MTCPALAGRNMDAVTLYVLHCLVKLCKLYNSSGRELHPFLLVQHWDGYAYYAQMNKGVVQCLKTTRLVVFLVVIDNIPSYSYG